MDIPLLIIEKDARFVSELARGIRSDHLIVADALDIDLKALFATKELTSPIWLVSNLPYNQAVPLLLKFFRLPEIQFLTVMMQKEMAEKLMPEQHRNGMNSLGVLAQSFFEVRQVCAVPPGAFIPPPEVHSAVLHLTRRADSLLPMSAWDSWEKYLRKIFSHRRKQLGTVLKTFYPAEQLKRALEDCQIDRTIRAEALTLQKVKALYDKLTPPVLGS